MTWYELSGAASATLFTHALLALAAEPDTDDAAIAKVSAAHWPWIALATTLLDSWVDIIEDADNDGHSYVDHYPDLETAIARMHDSVTAAMTATIAAPRGQRHAVIVACMVALYLTAESSNAVGVRATRESLTAAGGSLVRLLVPALHAWRHVYRQRS